MALFLDLNYLQKNKCGHTNMDGPTQHKYNHLIKDLMQVVLIH